MLNRVINSVQWTTYSVLAASLLALAVYVVPALAITPLPTPDPVPGSYGLEATKPKDPPKVGATITTPGNGASFNTSPITVSGICPSDLLVQVYNNGVMVGAVVCSGGSFSLQVSLFAGVNELTALVYDELDQSGPVSNSVVVNYTDTSFSAFGELITLTSSYGRRSSPAGATISWPLQLSGGTGPYAFSLDWGDGTVNELKSQSLAGLVTVEHAYKKAGIYKLNVKVTDTNGVSAFLQVIPVASGKVDQAVNTNTGDNKQVTKIIWAPAAVVLLLLPLAYWLGRRSMIVSLHAKMLKERDSYQDK